MYVRVCVCVVVGGGHCWRTLLKEGLHNQMQSLIEGVLSMLRDHSVTCWCLCEEKRTLESSNVKPLSSVVFKHCPSLKCRCGILYWNYELLHGVLKHHL